MPVPTWTVGEVLASADVNAWFVPLAAVRTSDQSVTSSTTLVNDDTLVLPIAASATYIFDCYMYFLAASGGDIKWTFAAPSGAVLDYYALHNEGGGTLLDNSATTYGASSTPNAAGGGGAAEAIGMHGTLAVSSTAGNLQLKWAQNTSSGTATTVKANSHLVLRRVG